MWVWDGSSYCCIYPGRVHLLHWLIVHISSNYTHQFFCYFHNSSSYTMKMGSAIAKKNIKSNPWKSCTCRTIKTMLETWRKFYFPILAVVKYPPGAWFSTWEKWNCGTRCRPAGNSAFVCECRGTLPVKAVTLDWQRLFCSRRTRVVVHWAGTRIGHEIDGIGTQSHHQNKGTKTGKCNETHWASCSYKSDQWSGGMFGMHHFRSYFGSGSFGCH